MSIKPITEVSMVTYMVDEAAVDLSFGVFVADPDRCPVMYSYSAEDERVDEIITFFDADSRQFTFEYTSGLDLFDDTEAAF